MGKHTHKTHSNGINDNHLSRLQHAFDSGGEMVDQTIRSITGTHEAVRGHAQAAFSAYLRRGYELPLPDIDYIPGSSGAVAVSQTIEVGVE